VPLAFPLGQLTPARISSAISPHPLLLHSAPISRMRSCGRGWRAASPP
jgi:hypothetical protein